MRSVVFILIALFSFNVTAQETEKLPYYQIPEYPESYTAGAVAARLVDGLGFRYYWATEALRDEDLAFKPNEDARTTAETIDHIYGLSNVIVNSTLKQPNDRTKERPELTYTEKRKQTLINLKTAADILRTSKDISQFMIIFKSDKGTSEFPFWNNINGPIADAIWHCGQVVLLRRSSGNPFNSKASLFRGKLRD
ncbi:hypothetical protein [Ichthyenterobacterium magnum]|uniref:DinB family protein n=1 Tax=Ichthyenterobacterium magnum TaxID=1230530 RepID=A0A420DFN5_9FLAO|nr:hypothetical protein [Ichthyenterobacterium magnum]RKE90849.1 hypothetical protein BXY80_2692 [Ichthyenterobacterium magnum]